MKIKFDTSDFDKKIKRAEAVADLYTKTALREMAEALLLISRDEVPHDEGVLSGSGFVYPEGKEMVVAYNTEYASYQHEGIRKDGTRPIVNYGKGRKGKYLEDPMKMNLSRWQSIFNDQLQNIFK